jgi:hypothetical protein
MQGWAAIIIIFESGVIGPRWGLPEWLGFDDDGFAAPCTCLPLVRDANDDDEDFTSVTRGP